MTVKIGKLYVFKVGLMIVGVILINLCSFTTPYLPNLDVISASSSVSQPLETWIPTSLNLTLDSLLGQPLYSQEAEEWIHLTQLHTHTRLIFYVTLSQVPANLSLTIQLGQYWTRHLLLIPDNCSFHTWVDVAFDIPWDHPISTSLDVSLRIQAHLATNDLVLWGWIGRFAIHSFDATPLTSTPQALPFVPQNQSRAFPNLYFWFTYNATATAFVQFPNTTNDLVLLVDVLLSWTGVKAEIGSPSIQLNCGNHTWYHRVGENGSLIAHFEEVVNIPSTQETILTTRFDLGLRGHLINVYFQIFASIREMSPADVKPTNPPSLLELVLVPSLIVDLVVIPAGLLGGRVYHHRKWQQKHGNVKQVLAYHLKEGTA